MSEVKSGGTVSNTGMKSAGISRKKHSGMETSVSGSGEQDKIYPNVSVDHAAMPHMKKHNEGDVGHMHIKYKVTGQHQYRSGEGNTEFEITHYEPAKRVKGKDDKEMKDSADKDEKDQPAANQK